MANMYAAMQQQNQQKLTIFALFYRILLIETIRML